MPGKISNEGNTFQWLFPRGTIIGEALFMVGPDGRYYCFEIRTRTKTATQWDIDAFRPFPTKQHLTARLQELGLERAAEQLNGEYQTLVYQRRPTVDRQVAKAVFREPNAHLDMLPKFSNNELVAKLLTTTTFQSSTGLAWGEDSQGHVCYAPTSAEPFSIVPAGYSGGVVNVDNQSCTRCHETTAHHAEEFAPNIGVSDFRAFRNDGPIPTHREWYGRVRGSDGIFSFYPFDPRQVSGLGSGFTMRRELVQAGVIAMYNPSKHPANMYPVIPEYDPRRTRYNGPKHPVVSAR